MFTSFLWSEEAIGPLQLSDQVVHSGQTGEQTTHWDMPTKPPNLNGLCLTCPSAPSAHQFGEPRDRSAAKGLFKYNISRRSDTTCVMSANWRLQF